MPPKPKTKQPTVYRSLAEVAANLDVGTDTVKRWRKEGMPGKAGRWVLADIVRWLRSDGPWKPNAKLHPFPSTAVGPDPLLEDVDSPAIERYRLAKAKHAELDLENRKGELIERDKCRDVLARWAILIRRMGERLAKRHGNDAAVTVNDTLEECRAVVKESLE